jgi:hypothetical protein
MKLSLNVGLAWPEVDDVYSVGYRGQTIGKMWLATDRQAEATPWEWHLCIPMTLPDDSKGAAHSKDLALQALANSLHRLLLHTPPDRIERAFRLSAATGLDFDAGEQIELFVEDATARPAIAAAEPAPVHAESLTASVQAVAQRAVSPVDASPLAAERGSRQVVVAKKRMPTVKVKMVTMDKSRAKADPPRPAPRTTPPAQSPSATDA